MPRVFLRRAPIQFAYGAAQLCGQVASIALFANHLPREPDAPALRSAPVALTMIFIGIGVDCVL